MDLTLCDKEDCTEVAILTARLLDDSILYTGFTVDACSWTHARQATQEIKASIREAERAEKQAAKEASDGDKG